VIQIDISEECFLHEDFAHYADDVDFVSDIYADSVKQPSTKTSELAGWLREDNEFIFPIDL